MPHALKLVPLTLAAAAWLLSAAALAQEGGPSWYVGAQAYHLQPDSARQARNAAGGTLLLGRAWSNGLAVELNAFGQALHARDDAPDTPGYGAGVNLNWNPARTGGQWFVLLGGGALHERVRDERGEPFTAGYARAGLGVYVPGFGRSVNAVPALHRNHWLLRADLSWIGVFDDLGRPEGPSRVDDVRLSVGIVFARSLPRAPRPETGPVPEAQVIDALPDEAPSPTEVQTPSRR